MYSTPDPLEFLLDSWSGRIAFALASAVVIFILETIFRWLGRYLWPCTDEGDEYLLDLESVEYRGFIEAEMARLYRKQGKTGGGKQRTRDKGPGKNKQQYGVEYNCRDISGVEAVGAEPKFMRATTELIYDWRGHPDLSRPFDSALTYELARGSDLGSTRIKQESFSKAERTLDFRSPAVSSKRASMVPPTTPPARRIKAEHTPTHELTPSSSSSSSSSTSSDFTPSSTSTIGTSPRSYYARSPTPEPPPSGVPSPGDSVFRRRPTKFILKNTVDETDHWDGPFMVLGVTLQNLVELLLPPDSKTPAWTAVKNIMLAHEKEAQTASEELREDGTKLYIIDKLRGVRGDKYLVHWKGWGCEDDTWEPKAGLPSVFIKNFERRARNWEQTKGSAVLPVSMRIEVEIPAGGRKALRDLKRLVTED